MAAASHTLCKHDIMVVDKRLECVLLELVYIGCSGQGGCS